jgi:3-oxoacyl-[acyl-carrier-protein] synthase-3
VWQAAPWIAHRLGASRAFALELDYVSCGAPVALRVARDMLLAEPEIGTVLAVAASRESYLLDYRNERSRFMFGFGDGAVAALLARGDGPAQVLGSHAVTDGSLSLTVKVPVGGSIAPYGSDGAATGRAMLDVADPAWMKQRLDSRSLPNFVEVAQQALRRSGASLADVSFVFPIHVKRSMHRQLLAALGVPEAHSVYLEDTGHMSGVDPLFAMDRAVRAGRLNRGDLVLLLAAGTGYSWAATVVRWQL